MNQKTEDLLERAVEALEGTRDDLSLMGHELVRQADAANARLIEISNALHIMIEKRFPK